MTPIAEWNNGMERSIENDKIAGVVGDYLMCLTLVGREASNGKRNENCLSFHEFRILGIIGCFARPTMDIHSFVPCLWGA